VSIMAAKISIPSPNTTNFDQKAAPNLSGTRASSKAKPISVAALSRSRSNSSEEVSAARSQAPTAVQPIEPEDAYLTGVSRSLQRRLLGLNVQGSQGQSKPVPATQAPGLHATGSFTGTTSVPARVARK